MLKLNLLIVLFVLLSSLEFAGAKRRSKFACLPLLVRRTSLVFHLATTQSQNNLGDFCIPGTCTSLNSNCKRVGGSAFRCVCKEQYLAVNKTHCGRLTRTSSEGERVSSFISSSSDQCVDRFVMWTLHCSWRCLSRRGCGRSSGQVLLSNRQ